MLNYRFVAARRAPGTVRRPVDGVGD
jgi:hypothetical protein